MFTFEIPKKQQKSFENGKVLSVRWDGETDHQSAQYFIDDIDEPCVRVGYEVLDVMQVTDDGQSSKYWCLPIDLAQIEAEAETLITT